MSIGLDDEVQALGRLDLTALRGLWARHWGEPPMLRSAELLARMIAWRLQAARYGGLAPDIQRRLRRPPTSLAGALQQGVVLTREWKGELVRVEVVEDGFRWDGRTYASLSQVARAVTGSRWNGPRFFGLRGGGAS